MATVKELLRAENDGTLSFGDYTLPTKTKKDNFEFEGDIYKVKTFAEITKLEKNGMFVYESVPGSTVENFKETDAEVTFTVSAILFTPLNKLFLASSPNLISFAILYYLLIYILDINHLLFYSTIANISSCLTIISSSPSYFIVVPA